MAIGQKKEFVFHAYFDPADETLQLNKIGSLRPPNELIQKAKQIASDKANEYEDEITEEVYLGKIKTGFIYVAGEPEKNSIDESLTHFTPILRETDHSKVGNPVTGEYEYKPHNSNYPTNDFQSYQDKGWLTVNGQFYSPDNSKPDGWSS